MTPELAQATAAALNELRTTSIDDIQKTTAITWAGRAIAAFQLYCEFGALHLLLDGEEYKHEALEHASLSLDPTILNAIRPELEQAAATAKALARVYHDP